MRVVCVVTWHGKDSTCSKNKERHVTPTGCINGAEKGQCKTNKACPYPFGFCEYIANVIAHPSMHFRRELGEIPKGAMAMVVGPMVPMELPPADH